MSDGDGDCSPSHSSLSKLDFRGASIHKSEDMLEVGAQFGVQLWYTVCVENVSACLAVGELLWPSLQCTISAAHDAGARRTRGEAPDIVLPNQDVECVRHVALDIGGSLIKLAYFSPGDVDSDAPASDSESGSAACDDANSGTGGRRSGSVASASTVPSPAAQPPAGLSVGGDALDAKQTGRVASAGGAPADAAAAYAKGAARGGRLHFVKFETTRVDEAIDFIKRKRLHCGNSSDPSASQSTVQVLRQFKPLASAACCLLLQWCCSHYCLLFCHRSSVDDNTLTTARTTWQSAVVPAPVTDTPVCEAYILQEACCYSRERSCCHHDLLLPRCSSARRAAARTSSQSCSRSGWACG